MEMISFGAGVNSIATTILLVNEGWAGPVVFADTGGEHPETYCYMTMFERDYLKPHGLELTRIGPKSEWYEARHDKPLYDFCLERQLIPILSVRWCSVEYKQDPLRKWAEAHDIPIRLIGFAVDEARRAKENPVLRYPLIERWISRAECIRIIQREGLPVPVKSGCFFCPGQRLGSWKRLSLDYPDLYERAMTLEETASAKMGRPVTLYPDGPSLRELRKHKWQGQTEIDLSEWMPCACVV